MKLDIKNVGKHFPDTDKQVFHDVNLSVSEGEFVCIIGPSGCGKSTLLNMIAGLETPSTGSLLLDEVVITKPGADRVVMFQEAALFPWLNVEENIRFGLSALKLEKEEQNRRIEKYLKLVQLSQFKKHLIHQLSGGMKQRVALARSLAMDSKILLMDEPLSALDKQTKNLLMEEIQSIWMQTKKTVILITHSVEEAIFFADRIILMGAKGAGIKEIIPVDFPRPRNITSPDFLKLRSEILFKIREEVNMTAKEEHDAD